MVISIVSSSTRNERNSHRVALALKNNFSNNGITVEIIDLAETPLPFFTERYSLLDQASITDSMKFISEKLRASTGIIFVTPEYNSTISPALLNLIDTFGRPEFGLKPIGVATVSTGAMGGVRAALQLQQIILAIQGYPQPQLLLTGSVTQHLDALGTVLTDEYKTKLDNFSAAFIKFASKFI